MSKSQFSLSSVSFSYDALATPLLRNLSFVASAGWTGIVGPNRVGKTTLLQIAAGALPPQSGSVSRPAPVVVCEQRTDKMPEARKLLLALGLLDEPQLIVMDEPTNHMDIVIIECLEAALRDYVGALSLVSHDQRFLDALTTDRWEIQHGADGKCQLLTL